MAKYFSHKIWTDREEPYNYYAAVAMNKDDGDQLVCTVCNNIEHFDRDHIARVICRALNESDKTGPRVHDLIKNSDDLPTTARAVLVRTHEWDVIVACRDAGAWWTYAHNMDYQKRINGVVAWQEIPAWMEDGADKGVSDEKQ